MNRFYLAVVLAGAGTYALRASMLVFARRIASVPPRVASALRMIPAAALAALVTPAVLREGGELDLLSARSVAGLIALVAAWWSKRVWVTLAVGIAAVLALDALGL